MKLCEFSTCQESWLTNATNPFSKEDNCSECTGSDCADCNPANAGCYAFYDYCRGYDPSRYQCKVFGDSCRTEQNSRNPGWKYPRENCTDTSISLTEDIVTCPMNWLDNLENPYTDEREQDETCYNFWDYCRNELDEINPEWEYPRPTCKDDNPVLKLKLAKKLGLMMKRIHMMIQIQSVMTFGNIVTTSLSTNIQDMYGHSLPILQ